MKTGRKDVHFIIFKKSFGDNSVTKFVTCVSLHFRIIMKIVGQYKKDTAPANGHM
jgi:hypothetical protein